MNKHLSFETIEKIISGEICPRERKAILSQWDAEDSSSHWRALALGFLEKQFIKEAFHETETVIQMPRRKNTLKMITAAVALVLLTVFVSLQFYPDKQKTFDITREHSNASDYKQPPEYNSIIENHEKSQSATAYVTTHLSDGRDLVIPISYNP